MSARILKVEALHTRHWWVRLSEFFVYENESDWPPDKTNERGNVFDGKGTHYRLEKEEKYILKSDCTVIGAWDENGKSIAVIGNVNTLGDYMEVKPYINVNSPEFLEAQHNITMELFKEYLQKDDPVNHPTHYTSGKIEVCDFILDQQLTYLRGQVIKYVARAGKKDPAKELEDLKKAAWYLNREIERIENGK